MTVEKQLDKIFETLQPVVGAGWIRKQDVGDMKIYEIIVPKSK